VRKSVVSKVKGAAQFFVTDTVTSPEPVTDKDTDTNTDMVEVAVTSPNTGTVENTVTVTDTVTSPLIKPSEILHRMIGYYTSEQRKFIKGKAKKYNVTEAEIMRLAVEELMKSGKI
jgi:hypothetical protein